MNNTVNNPVLSAWTVLTVIVDSVMAKENSFWVLYGQQGFNSTVLRNEEGDIDCRTLDSFALTNVDFVKIDVDGFEIPLLNGAKDTLIKNNPVINIEMKNDKRSNIAQQCEHILKDLGYKFHKRTKSDEVWLKS